MEKLKVYEANKNLYMNPIRIREYVSETPKFYIKDNGQKGAKETAYYDTFKTFEEAKEYLISVAENKVAIAESRLKSAQADLERMKSLTQEAQ